MIQWQWHTFNELSNQQLYDILQLREAVFQIEQQCIYPDIDGTDPQSMHLSAYDKQHLAAYLRIYQKGNDQHIGRIVTTPDFRGKGLGKELIVQCLLYLKQNYPERDIKMSAQLHLTKFYEGFGFEIISEPYDEDGIMHIDMGIKASYEN